MTCRRLRSIGAIVSVFVGGCAHLNPSVTPGNITADKGSNFAAPLLTPRAAPAVVARPKGKPYDPFKINWPKAYFKTVSLSATDDVPLKEILLRLAQDAGVDLALDGDVTGGATLHIQSRPFIEIVETICRAHQLRPRLASGILRIERDIPFLHVYHLPFLSLSRTNQNRTSIATDVFSSVEGRRGDLDNGSNTILTEEAKTDIWSELDENMSTLLLRGGRDGLETDSIDSSYTLHKQGGILTVYGTMDQHRQINDYVTLLRRVISGQVLIEAKVVEVLLKDEFKTGINWNTLRGDFVVQSPLGSLATPGVFVENRIPKRDAFTIGAAGSHLTGLMSLMEKFGTVRTLSSPRLTVMNNQSAILKVATNHVFFRIDYNRDYGYDVKREHERVTSEIQTVPIGLVMVVHPSIDSETGKIVMTIRPTISRVIREKADPAVAIVSQEKQQSFIPEVQVREMDTVIAMQSGDIAVMGGLMQEQSAHDQTAVPGASDLPLVGFLFKGNDRLREVSELVIFLKATILDDDNTQDEMRIQSTSYDGADQAVYQNMTSDPRPLPFSAQKIPS